MTYIEMIKDLQNKTFKLNLDGNHDRSIIMKKRETAINHNKIFTTKLLDNQMFDVDGNILLTNSSSLKNSFNQANFLNNMLVHGMPPCGSIYKTHELRKAGPQAHISPMLNIRKADIDENSIKPTCSSHGPSSRVNFAGVRDARTCGISP